MLFAASGGSSSSSDDEEDPPEKGEEEKRMHHWEKKYQKQQQRRQRGFFFGTHIMRRAASVGDLLRKVDRNTAAIATAMSKKKKKKKTTIITAESNITTTQNIAIAILSSLLFLSLLVNKQQNTHTKIREIDSKLHNTISALTTRAQWSEVEKKKDHQKIIRKRLEEADLLDEYGLPTFAAQCERGVKWPLISSSSSSSSEHLFTEESLCEAFLDELPKTLRVHAFPLNAKAQMKYNALRKLPTFNRGYDVEDYLVKWLSNGPFSKINHETLTAKTKIAYLVAVQPYLDRVSSFPFTNGRTSISSALKHAIQYAKKVNPSLWKQSKGRRVIVNAHDFGTELATGIFPDEDDKDDDDVYDDNNDKNYQSSSLINTTHFIVSNSECEVEEAPFDAKKDVAVVPSLSFFLPREAISRRLVDLSHFMRDEDEYVSFGLELPKYDADRHIRLMFRGTNRGPLREEVFQFLTKNGNPEDSIETTGVASPQEYMSLMEQSRYCLHVRGTRVMSPRLIELMLFGCVPVIVSDAYELPLAWFLDWSKFSIRVPESEYENIHSYIESANWRELHSNLGRVLSFFVYHKNSPIIGDAFYATSLALLKKIERQDADADAERNVVEQSDSY
tara:strand:+ start:540 stop:2393 length:1854 start_codon:yes stop_codon:yes gene_type:complete